MSEPTRRRGASDWFFAVLSFLVAAVGVFAAYIGETPWWPPVLFAAGGVLFLWAPTTSPIIDEIEITEHGITQRYKPKFQALTQVTVPWAEVTMLEIQTTDSGPGAEDFYFLLRGLDGKGVAVSNSLAVKHGLLAELQKRFPDLDHMAVVVASGSTENRNFTIWKRADQFGA